MVLHTCWSGLFSFIKLSGPKLVPIGLLSEEAQQSRNKDVKNYSKYFTGKFLKKLTNDLMRRLLCSSIPDIAFLRRSCLQDGAGSP